MRGVLWRFIHEEAGATSIEYALIASMFAIVAVAAANALGQAMSSTYTNIETAVVSASAS